MWRAIAWTNDDPFCYGIFTLLNLNEVIAEQISYECFAFDEFVPSTNFTLKHHIFMSFLHGCQSGISYA